MAANETAGDIGRLGQATERASSSAAALLSVSWTDGRRRGATRPAEPKTLLATASAALRRLVLTIAGSPCEDGVRAGEAAARRLPAGVALAGSSG